MENIVQLLTNLLGGGANNSVLMLLIGAAIWFFTQQKKPTPSPTVTPKSGDLQAGLIDLFNFDPTNMPILAWFAQLPQDQQAAFWAAVMKKVGTLGK